MRFTYRRRPDDEQVVPVDIVPHPERAGTYCVTVGERVFELSEHLVHQIGFLKEAGSMTLQWQGLEYRFVDASQRRRATPRHVGDLRAPMAGKIIRVLVQPGAQVAAGTPLLILEAMKMEHQITAPQDGTVTRLLCREGDQVATGAELAVVEPAEVVSA
jgi:biotin carboxyl carrier protein